LQKKNKKKEKKSKMGEVLVVDFPTFLIVVLVAVLAYRFFKSRFSRRVTKPADSTLPASNPVPDCPVVGQVSELWVFPIKSCRGIRVDSAKLGPRGFEMDRLLMLVRAETEGAGENEALSFVSLRNVPRLVEFDVAIEGSSVVVNHKSTGMLRIERSDGVPGVSVLCRLWDDELLCQPISDAADQFFSSAMGVKLRLVRVGDAFQREVPRDHRDSAAILDTGMADGFPYLLTSTSSLAAVSKQAGVTIDMRRFRANIVMKTSIPAFQEDEMAEIKIGEHAVFRNLKICSRCKVPRLSPEDGTEDKDGQPTKALQDLNHFHKGEAYFGVNLAHLVGMEVRRGGSCFLVDRNLKFSGIDGESGRCNSPPTKIRSFHPSKMKFSQKVSMEQRHSNSKQRRSNKPQP
jgi:uncharacterized protein YcbX